MAAAGPAPCAGTRPGGGRWPVSRSGAGRLAAARSTSGPMPPGRAQTKSSGDLARRRRQQHAAALEAVEHSAPVTVQARQIRARPGRIGGMVVAGGLQPVARAGAQFFQVACSVGDVGPGIERRFQAVEGGLVPFQVHLHAADVDALDAARLQSAGALDRGAAMLQPGPLAGRVDRPRPGREHVADLPAGLGQRHRHEQTGRQIEAALRRPDRARCRAAPGAAAAGASVSASAMAPSTRRRPRRHAAGVISRASPSAADRAGIRSGSAT